MRVLLWSSLVLTTLGSLIVLIVGIQRWFGQYCILLLVEIITDHLSHRCHFICGNSQGLWCFDAKSQPRYVCGRVGHSGLWISEHQYAANSASFNQLLCNVLIVVATALNSLSRPRGAYTRLTSLLTKDGILYFTVIFGRSSLLSVLHDLTRARHQLSI
jgi:hypothetical protein